MLSRTAKALFYHGLGPVMRLNGAVYRAFRAPRAGTVKVQLGPGQKNYLRGWVNVDANMFTGKCDLWTDFTKNLPFRDSSVDAFYSHHVVEHFPDSLLPLHFKEIYRCLKPGGIFRVGGPNGDMAMRKYAEGDLAWFSSDFPDKRSSLGGRLANYILCRGEHLTILTPSYLQEIATHAGLGELTICKPKTETRFPQFIDEAVLGTEWETTPDFPHTLIVEGQKE